MILGRDAQRSRIGELLDGARASRSAALVICGEPGVGKSALLADARERAGDMRVLSGSGVESEAQLPFAALHQILRPVLDLVENLPRPQAEALRVALGLEAGGGSDRFLVSLAALSLLAEAAEEQPLLCLVDDAHWLDDSSADALVFVARRLEAEGIVMLFAAREGERRSFEAPSLPKLYLDGLDPEAAGALLDRSLGRVLAPAARERLIEGTGGNPLALLALPATLTDAQLAGTEPLFDPLPVSERVEQAFAAHVARLPEETQLLLLVGAADDSGDLHTVVDAAARLGASLEALDAAEEAELVRVGSRLEFRHPLVRSAIYQAAPLSRRQAAHRALAETLGDKDEADRRAWHRAAASVEPDPSVVEELEQAAERARRRSGFATASLAYERAAALTADGHQQVRQLAAAAESAWLAGQLDRGMALLERARPAATDPTERSDLDRWRGLIEMNRGRPIDAYPILIRAADETAGIDDGRTLDLLNLAGLAAAYAGDGAAQVAVGEAAARLSVADDPALQMLAALLVGIGAHARGDFASAVPNLRRALAFVQELPEPTVAVEAGLLFFTGRVALYLGDDTAVYRAHRDATARAREAGAVGLLTQILPISTMADVWAGRWEAGEANAREGLRLGRELAQHHLAAQARVLLALLAALRGNEDECRRIAVESREVASASGLGVVGEFSQWSLLLLELASGRAEAALSHARGIANTIAVIWTALDRIEAAIRAGEEETGREWLADFELWAESCGADWARAVALHGRALLSRDEQETEDLFRAALDRHAAANRPFERARSELAFGEFLRRSRRRVDSREHLSAALDTFEALGASVWAERARVELRASGQTARKRDPSTRGELTPQELQIAAFVAQGLSNRDVAAQLFLSPRTIAFHLRNIFRKLGISSRTQLARLELDSAGDAEAASPAIPTARA